ncbi:hypothetical protein SMSK564_0993 [Streptococcus mitis SK564]|uniref:Uncharacterized protein n=1 Tax=Streptococcus mitis SK564 TaxID=585203 RepID=E1LM22_STRMT|nr:hypothetical protein SMSK564_0993 [Streptococcus mitis SK564]
MKLKKPCSSSRGTGLFRMILFENLFKPRQFYLQPQNSVLS